MDPEDKIMYKGDLYESTGTLNYGIQSSGYRLVLDVDQSIVDYYLALMPKALKVNKQAWPAHITVVRNEPPVNPSSWGKHHGEEVKFVYANYIQEGKIFYWLNVFSKKLEDIRVELGLPVRSQYTIPPEGFTKCFHMTLGNTRKCS